jgi:broad specificity phosphatase PhoE
MRTIEHRRHSRRDRGGVHLNADGLALARRVAPGLGPFDRVATSPLPRAAETAEALGVAVDTTLPGLASLPDEAGLDAEIGQLDSFAAYARLYRASSAMAAYSDGQAALSASELRTVPDGGALLMVSHRGMIEAGAVAAPPELAASWGAPLGDLEGVRLRPDDARWTSGEVLRVPP